MENANYFSENNGKMQRIPLKLAYILLIPTCKVSIKRILLQSAFPVRCVIGVVLPGVSDKAKGF